MIELSYEINSAIDELPAQVQSMVDYARRVDPNVVVVCDRDARPIGQVFEMLALAEGYEVPTLYRHISKRIGPQPSGMIAEHCHELPTIIENVDGPIRIMAIDDYVSNTATTMSLFRAAMRRLPLGDIDLHWVTLAGRGTALNVLPYAGPSTVSPWRDRPDIIGIDYDGLDSQIVDTPLSRQFNALLGTSVKKYLESKRLAE